MKHGSSRILLRASVAVVVATVGVVACGSNEPACAKAGAPSGGSSGGGKSSGGGASAGGRSGGASSGGGASRSGGGSATGSGSKSAPAAPKAPPPPSASQSSAAAASKPSSKPAPENVSKARAEAPPRVTSGGSYYSGVTGATYVYHDVGFYGRPGYIVDIYDPYNPYNYWHWSSSPYYGRPYRVANSCDAADETEVPKQEINITIDNDGKVVAAETTSGSSPATTPGTTEGTAR